MPTTLKQVAQAARCSVAVASKVLNNAKGNVVVSTETSDRVRKIAQQMGYRPNHVARSLVSRTTKTIGLFIWQEGPFSGISQDYEANMIAGIDEVTRQRGYDTMLLNASGDDPLGNCIDKCRQGRFDGLILLRTPEDETWLNQLAKHMPHVVAINTLCEAPQTDVAIFDHHMACKLALEHLMSLGHRKIGFIGNTRPIHAGSARRDIGLEQRQLGFIKAAKVLGLDIDERWIFDTQWKQYVPKPGEDFICQEGHMAVQWFESLDNKPTAYIGGVFRSAIGAVQQCQQMGLTVPDQRSIVGIGDREWCKFITPALTTISNSLTPIGHWAATRLIDRIEHKAHATQGVRQVFAPELILRQSTGPCEA